MSARLLSSKTLQQLHQSDQILTPKEGSASSNFDKWIDASGIRAARQNRLQLACAVTVIHTILTPVIAVLEQFELTPKQGMEWMSYAEAFHCTAVMRCN